MLWSQWLPLVANFWHDDDFFHNPPMPLKTRFGPRNLAEESNDSGTVTTTTDDGPNILWIGLVVGLSLLALGVFCLMDSRYKLAVPPDRMREAEPAAESTRVVTFGESDRVSMSLYQQGIHASVVPGGSYRFDAKALGKSVKLEIPDERKGKASVDTVMLAIQKEEEEKVFAIQKIEEEKAPVLPLPSFNDPVDEKPPMPIRKTKGKRKEEKSKKKSEKGKGKGPPKPRREKGKGKGAPGFR